MKKNILVPLGAILVAALVLFGLSLGLKGVASAGAQRAHQRDLETLLPGSKSFVIEPYTGEDENIRSVHKGETGFVIETATRGYADEVVVLVGVSKEGKVTGLVVRQMHETWSLGAEALSDWEFLAQFLNTTGSAEVGSDVDALTGATVTSKAIARCVNSAVCYVTGADAESGATSWGG